MVPLAEFRDVGKTFTVKGHELRAVTDINLTVLEGDFITLVGPSGCGKSTLLNMIAGLFRPTTGVVLYRGVEVSQINRRVGYMTQQDHLLPWRDVVGNIAVPLEIRDVPRKQRRETVERLMALVGLTGFETSYPSQLSGGMRKRCALARVLAYDPETLLMDEPFGALDAQLRMTMQTEIMRICSDLKKTVLFVTHDLDEAIALASRCIVFGPRPGTIVQEIPVDLGQPRGSLINLRFDKRYIELTSELWRIMAPSLAQAEG